MAFYPLAGRKTVTTAGTPVPLSAVTGTVQRLFVRAIPSNTKNVAVGQTGGVSAQSGSEAGLLLAPTDAPQELGAVIPSALYVDAAVSGEGVAFLILQ